MHELSIANSLIEIATQAAVDAGATRVTEVRLRIGVLTCVHRNALEFCYELATKDTILEGSQLAIIEVPLVIHCPACDADVELPTLQSFQCPVCGTPSADVRQGKDLEVESIQIDQDDPASIRLCQATEDLQ